MWNRSRVWLLGLMSGGGLFVLQGCDPTVRESVLTGVGSAATGLATTFINAFFQGLITDAQEDPTVVLRVIEELPQFFC
jgi:hypothetical protein